VCRTQPRGFRGPIGAFLDKQPPALHVILDELRALTLETAPEAQPSIKWGNTCFTVDGAMICGLRPVEPARNKHL
jgi:uncharacterized protein YdhG (YjbR/CyaY superfamily)